MKKLLIVLTLICSAMLVVGAQTGFAWSTYEGGCQACHGSGFAALNSHSIHAGVTCTACHPGAAGAIPIPSSTCSGCHPAADPGLCPLIDVPTHAAIKNTCLACHTKCAPPPPVEQVCFDQQDDDGDGLTDCADPDCNGAIDGACDTGLEGPCASGSVFCVNGVASCLQNFFPVPEVCNDGIDNDCDGFIDVTDPDCPINCDDGDACTVDTFDPSSGQCLHAPKNCDDGVFCNGTESCEPTTGNCVAVSACPPAIDGCVIRGATCDELNDVCVDFADDSLCDDSDPSTTDTCDPKTGECVNKDITPPEVSIITPKENVAVQDGVTFQAQAFDFSGIYTVTFSVREPDGGEGIPIGYDDLEASYNSTSGYWEYFFDTTQLQDGYYVIFAKATDTVGNEGKSSVVPFSIRNWAVITQLPATPNSKAGRTMPVKFSLRIAKSVDPAMPFVYNEDLEIRIYDAKRPGTILQTSVYGTGSKDYRIDLARQLYQTNFQTGKTPTTYVVEIWRPTKNFLVGSFTFKTVK